MAGFIASCLRSAYEVGSKSSLRSDPQISAGYAIAKFKQVKDIDIEERTKMGKVIEQVKLTSLFEPKKSVEVEAVIDTGATMPGRRNLFVE
ncbi:MAG: hypothetical protein OCU22_09400 [Canidatus Methanoxibalbensis ujae]|nr:hypothetical protein [Candidatus Methanoxibalbensis ujae]